MAIKHKHHIIPKHAGGSNDPSNLVTLLRYVIYKNLKNNDSEWRIA